MRQAGRPALRARAAAASARAGSWTRSSTRSSLRAWTTLAPYRRAGAPLRLGVVLLPALVGPTGLR